MGNANIKSFTTKVTSANTDTQIFKAPWLAYRRYIINKLIITNEGAATVVKFYDKDLSNVTPVVRGDSVNAPLLEFNVGANTTLFLDERTAPKEFFQAGMVANSSIANQVITVEITED